MKGIKCILIAVICSMVFVGCGKVSTLQFYKACYTGDEKKVDEYLQYENFTIELNENESKAFVNFLENNRVSIKKIYKFSKKLNPKLNIFKDEKAYNELCENAYRDLYKNWDDTVKEVYERYEYLYEKKQKEIKEKEEKKLKRKNLEK